MHMLLTNHQVRLIKSMIHSISEYRNENISFRRLVFELESLLDTGDFKEQKFIDSWYSHWTPLEIRNAVKGDDVPYEEASSEILEMEKFLISVLGEKASDPSINE